MPDINDITTNGIYEIEHDIVYIVLFCMQDCVCLVAPYPFRSDPLDEFNAIRDFYITGAADVWYALQQLFFKYSMSALSALSRMHSVAYH